MAEYGSGAEQDPRRLVPRTDALLAEPRIAEAVERVGARTVREIVGAVQQSVRDGALGPQDAVQAILGALPAGSSSFTPVLNATGIVLHTNLGRASLSQAAVDALVGAVGYVDVEYDLATGRRGLRGAAVRAAMLAVVAEAEDALVVNNGAAALILATTALASGREILVSRGELVEIGDGFRLPALIESTGARIREVGTTNRTTERDYRDAIDADTAAILKVHPSNFRIEGFTSSVGVAPLAECGLPLIVDIGSGLLSPDPMLPDEPDARSVLQAGATLVTCSGDKLLGGPQAGLLFGSAEFIGRLRRHPLARALRLDKLRLAALEATLGGPPTPTARFLHLDDDELYRRAAEVAERVAEVVPSEVVPSDGAVGGGGAPGVVLPGWAVALPEALADPLRRGAPAVIGRIEHGRCLLDLRCVPPECDDALVAAVRSAQQGNL